MELEVIGERLEKVYDGSRDIAIGISGFGSLKCDPYDWHFMGPFTGRTTYSLRYDAQEIPFDMSQSAFGNLKEAWMNYDQLKYRWMCARLAGAAAAEFLRDCIEQWIEEGRKVIVVGFSLGGWVAWEACKGIPSKDVDCVLLSAAVSTRPESWNECGVERMGSVVNVYSNDDRVLKSLYPHAEPLDCTAAGLQPVAHNGVKNIDMTDFIGVDHSKGSATRGHAYKLFRCAMAHICSNRPLEPMLAKFAGLDGDWEYLPLSLYCRLSRWAVVDGELWEILGDALGGDKGAIDMCIRLDAWSFHHVRLPYLIDMGLAAMAIFRSHHDKTYTYRSYKEISGLLRAWIERSVNIDYEEIDDLPIYYDSSPAVEEDWAFVDESIDERG